MALKGFIVQAWKIAARHVPENCDHVYTVRAETADDAARRVLAVADASGLPIYAATDTYTNTKAGRFCGSCFRGDEVLTVSNAPNAPRNLLLVCDSDDAS